MHYRVTLEDGRELGIFRNYKTRDGVGQALQGRVSTTCNIRLVAGIYCDSNFGMGLTPMESRPGTKCVFRRCCKPGYQSASSKIT